MDSEAECGQLHLEQNRTKIVLYKKDTKTKVSAPLIILVTVQHPRRQSKLNQKDWRKGFVKQMSFKSGIKGSDRW